jgi:hypothetical protein
MVIREEIRRRLCGRILIEETVKGKDVSRCWRAAQTTL